jgi:exopolysaccharide biosynthesis polyprenyl glycosylphosphotransferase
MHIDQGEPYMASSPDAGQGTSAPFRAAPRAVERVFGGRRPGWSSPRGLGLRRRAPKQRAGARLREGGPRSEVARRDATFRIALIAADLLAAGLVLVLCIGVVGDTALRPLALLALPLVLIAGKAQNLYDRDEQLINKTTIDQGPGLFHLATLYALIVFLAQDSFVEGELAGHQVVLVWGAMFALVIGLRRGARWLARRVTTVERCLFVGTEASHVRLLSKLERADRRAVVVARMSLTPAVHDPFHDPAAILRGVIEELNVHRVIVEPSEAAPQATLDFVREAKATGARVSLLPRILEVVGTTIEIDDLDGLTLLGVRRFGLSRSSRVLKRSFDLAGAALGLVALAPLLAIVALLVKRDSPGPVFYRQLRIGRDGRPFRMWKFRTMVDGADALKQGLRERNESEGLFKIAADPRVTTFGRRLRACSLDELPQLVNVLRGEMSLVGPRPLVLDEDARITGLDRRRLMLTPGMTGHWQILGSNVVPLAEMVKLDYLYVGGWSLWTDVKILLRTVPHILASRGI